MAYQFMIKKRKYPATDLFLPEAFIYLRYSYKETDCLISTGRKIDVEFWDEKKEELRRGYPGKEALDKLLTKIKADVETAEANLRREGDEPIASEVKKRYSETVKGSTASAIKVETLWAQFIKDQEGKRDPKTIKNLMSSFHAFQAFCHEKKKGTITLRKVNRELILSFETWLSNKSQNTQAKRLKHFKAFLRAHKHPATEDIKFKEVPGNKIFLTEAELSAFENYKFKTPNLLHESVRDLVLLQCNTGLRISDLLRIGPEHIQGKDLLIRAKKNDSFIRMPVSSRIAEILAKYNYNIPKVEEHLYNNTIKDIAALIIPDSKVELTDHRGGVKTKTTVFKHTALSSHDFVRTFINLAAQRGMPIPSIAVLTGKTVATLLKNYLNPSAEKAYEDAIHFDRPAMVIAN